VRALDEGLEQAGARSIWWDRRDDSGARVGAGVYWVRLASEQGDRSVKVVVVD
jgi:hypothetical protein